MSTTTPNERNSTYKTAATVSDDMICQYSQSDCDRERAIKENGKRHSLCEFHRDKANSAQRRSAQRKREENRRKRALEHAQEQGINIGLSIDDLIKAAQLQSHSKTDNQSSHEGKINQTEVDLDEEDLKWLKITLSKRRKSFE